MVDDKVRPSVPSTEETRRVLARLTRELSDLVEQVRVQIGYLPGDEGDHD